MQLNFREYSKSTDFTKMNMDETKSFNEAPYFQFNCKLKSLLRLSHVNYQSVVSDFTDALHASFVQESSSHWI